MCTWDPEALPHHSAQHEPGPGTQSQLNVSLRSLPRTHCSREDHLGRMPPFPSDATCLGHIPLDLSLFSTP